MTTSRDRRPEAFIEFMPPEDRQLLARLVEALQRGQSIDPATAVWAAEQAAAGGASPDLVAVFLDVISAGKKVL